MTVYLKGEVAWEFILISFAVVEIRLPIGEEQPLLGRHPSPTFHLPSRAVTRLNPWVEEPGATFDPLGFQQLLGPAIKHDFTLAISWVSSPD